MYRMLPVLLCVGCLAPAPAQAVTPSVGPYLAHGDAWHIELHGVHDRRFVKELVLHSERCDRTVVATRVPIFDDGTIDFPRPSATAEDREGTWRLQARWVAPNHV